MDLFDFIQVVGPTKVKVGEREGAEGEVKLLDSNVGRVVLLLPVALTRAKCGGHDADIELVTVAEDVVVVTVERPRRQHKKRQAVQQHSQQIIEDT
nr:hypothetical protein [Tanacetum cinerariifolium]